MKKFLCLLVLISMVFLSCQNEDRERVACFSPPGALRFEIVDNSTGENLFTNGTYLPSQIRVTKTLTNTPADFTFVSENDQNLLLIGGIGWQTEVVDFKIEIAERTIFNLNVFAERKNDKCSYTQFTNVAITDSNFEYNPQTGIYKILVE